MTRHFFVSLRNIFFTSFIRYLLRQTQNEFFIFSFSDSLIISFRDIFKLSFLSEKKILSLRSRIRYYVIHFVHSSVPSLFLRFAQKFLLHFVHQKLSSQQLEPKFLISCFLN